MLASAAGSYFSEVIAKAYHAKLANYKNEMAERAVRIPTENAAVRVLLSIAANVVTNLVTAALVDRRYPWLKAPAETRKFPSPLPLPPIPR